MWKSIKQRSSKAVGRKTDDTFKKFHLKTIRKHMFMLIFMFEVTKLIYL